MTGYRAMLRTELRDITHTWRIAVIPGLLLLTAATSPILASLAPHLLASSLASSGIHLPDPTAWDAYEQWTKNLTPWSCSWSSSPPAVPSTPTSATAPPRSRSPRP